MSEPLDTGKLAEWKRDAEVSRSVDVPFASRDARRILALIAEVERLTWQRDDSDKGRVDAEHALVAERAAHATTKAELDGIVAAMRDGQKHAAWIGFDQRKAWREECEAFPSHGDNRRVLALLDLLDAPCGSCHPCSHWANQTWVNEGERLPHVHEWQELRARADVLAAKVARCEALADELDAPMKADALPWEGFYDGFAEAQVRCRAAIRAALGGDE